MFDPAHDFPFARYLPMFDPDHFNDVGFFRELEGIGYEQVLIGGTGAGRMADIVAAIRAETRLKVVLYPGGPAAVTDADLVVLPDVMNSNSHHARPFGSGSVATAAAVAARRLPFVPVAYFIMGDSTAGWYYDAFRLPSEKVLLGYAQYARMVGYRIFALDYEDPRVEVRPELIAQLRRIPDLHLLVSEEATPEGAAGLLGEGVDTMVTPSDLYEEASDPLALAATYHQRLLR